MNFKIGPRSTTIAVFASLTVIFLAIAIGLVVESRYSPLASFLSERRSTKPIPLIDYRRQSNSYLSLGLTTIKARADSGGVHIIPIDNQIIVASMQGKFAMIEEEPETHTYRYVSSDLHTPMNWDALQKSAIHEDPLFISGWFRTHDVAVYRAPDNVYLVSSFHRFEKDCFEFVVARTAISLKENALEQIGEWEDLFVATPCVGLKSEGHAFSGNQSGGGILIRNSKAYFGIGDIQYDGLASDEILPGDLGKVFELDLENGDVRQLAEGVRNPQGITGDDTGLIWFSDHGPEGGDEINILREGAHFGWPYETMGTEYGRFDWPVRNEIDTEQEYISPIFAFVPAVAPTSTALVSGDEFPEWRNDLLVATKRGETLYRLKTDGTRIIFAEPLKFSSDLSGQLRDVSKLEDGRIAFSYEDGRVGILSRHEANDGPIISPSIVGSPPYLGAPSSNGVDRQLSESEKRDRYLRSLFAQRCGSCHGLGPESQVGPSLANVVGRNIASLENYAYSEALLAQSDTKWTRNKLKRFLIDPQSVAEGTSMPTVYLEFYQYDDLIDYLEKKN